MEIKCNLIFEGRNSLRWIQEDKEEGLIDLLFECDGNEQCLSFEPSCFETVAKMMNKYAKGDVEKNVHRDNAKIVKNILVTSGRVKPNVQLWMDEEPVSIEVEWENPAEDNPCLAVSSRQGRALLAFSLAQAKKIAECCNKIIELRQSIKDIQKKKDSQS